jgi:hypothetical protein
VTAKAEHDISAMIGWVCHRQVAATVALPVVAKKIDWRRVGHRDN